MIACIKPAQNHAAKIAAWLGKGHEVPTLDNELVAIDGYWEKESQLPSIVALDRLPISSGWPYICKCPIVAL